MVVEGDSQVLSIGLMLGVDCSCLTVGAERVVTFEEERVKRLGEVG